MYDTHIWVKYVICFCLVLFSFYNMPFLNPLSTQSYRLTSSYSLKYIFYKGILTRALQDEERKRWFALLL